MGKNTKLAIEKSYPGWKPIAEKYFTFPDDFDLNKFRKIQIDFAKQVYSI